MDEFAGMIRRKTVAKYGKNSKRALAKDLGIAPRLLRYLLKHPKDIRLDFLCRLIEVLDLNAWEVFKTIAREL